jgi:hypothetical protein
VEVALRVGAAARRLGAFAVLAACHASPPAVGPAAAQGARGTAGDSARADSTRRGTRGQLIPAGFGSLRRDDVAVRVQTQGLTVTAIPLDEGVLRTLSPDSYKALHALRESKAKALDSISARMGLPSVQPWQVLFFNQEQGEARFDPNEIVIRSVGRDFRPLRVLPISPGFSDGRLAQRATKQAVYAFDAGIDLSQPLSVTIGTQESSAWGDILQRLERERSLVWSRAAAAKP